MSPTKAGNDTLLPDKMLDSIRLMIEREAKALAPTKRIRSAIEAKITRTQTGKTISFLVRRSDTSDGATGAPEARAYEYGSGIHSQSARRSTNQLGPRGKILIKPKKKKVLAFAWQKADRAALANSLKSKSGKLKKFAGFGKGDKLLFNFVHHPGVEAANQGRGYLGYAVERTKDKVLKTVSDASVRAVADEINKISRRFGRKSK